MKYKNQLIIGSSILVIILAVFIGTRVIENTKANNARGEINQEINDIADDGIIDKENLDKETTDTEDKVDENKTEDTTVLDDKQNVDDAGKDITEENEEDKTNETDKEIDKSEEREEEKEPKAEEDTSSKTVDEDGNTQEEVDKETAQTDGENVVYVFKNKYVVQPKETLSDVVKKCLMANKLDSTNSVYFNYAQKLITKINNIADPNLIITGDEMILPTKANFKGLIPNGEAYKVQKGDTIHQIVKDKMSWCEYYRAKDLLMENNGIQNENDLKAGITLYIPTQDSEV